ncbi:TorF family putative porin [Phenylobacterium sp.]|uniref:TorF family putative porin n=1 Tax=Phenylobacterium sp. TaxID=1871053 RepID=UPI002F4134EF
MSKHALWLCAASAFTLMTSQAWADDAPAGPTVAFNAAITNDYLFRGLSQTSGKSAAQGGVDVTAGMFYAGTWLSNVDFGATASDPQNKTSIEYDLYAGVRPVLGPLNLDVGVIRYGYTDSPKAAHYDYWEGKILASHTMGPATIGAAFYYSPEFFGKVGDAEYYELNGAYTLSNKATISGAFGYQDLQKSKAGISNYSTWNIGVGYPVTDHIAVDLRYVDTSQKATRFYTKTFAGDRIVGTLKVTF